jgi:2',3'-cyclic-nucleotide 2'-phosphodiesterase (5'-nucleotidase family)
MKFRKVRYHISVRLDEIKKISFFLLMVTFNSCCKDDMQNPVSLGEIQVNLDASKSAVRTQEALIGDLISDAIKADAEARGRHVDFALMNGGGIRFDPENRPLGIYPAGLYTSEMVDEILPFGNTNVVVKVTGWELKQIFERSVAQLPLAQGPYLQVSKELKIIIDTNRAPQVINDLVEPNVIINNGNRIVSIKINNVEYDSVATYTLVTSNFIAEGNDGYIAFKNIGVEKKEFFEEDQSGSFKEYIILNTPLMPVIEGRIVYQ